jgi:hypothetical protein
MKQKTCVILMMLAISSLAVAAGPDYSGSWSLEQVSGMMHGKPFLIEKPDEDSGIVIEHTLNSLRITSDCARCGNLVKEYTLDSKTREMPNDAGAVISYSAKWDGDAIVINQGFGGPSPFGSVVVVTRKSFSISADGEILTVFSTDKDPEGEMTMTQIYRKIR